MSSELELSLWALLLFALFTASIVYVAWDWLRAREKRKRYNLWFNQQLIASLNTRTEALEGCRHRQNTMQFMLYQALSDESWKEREEELNKKLNKLRQERNVNYRPLDYYRYQEANQ